MLANVGPQSTTVTHHWPPSGVCVMFSGMWWAGMNTSDKPVNLELLVTSNLGLGSPMAHDVVAPLNQRQWRWSNVATTSCAQWEGQQLVEMKICGFTALTLASAVTLNRKILCGGEKHWRFWSNYQYKTGANISRFTVCRLNVVYRSRYYNKWPFINQPQQTRWLKHSYLQNDSSLWSEEAIHMILLLLRKPRLRNDTLIECHYNWIWIVTLL